MYNPIWILKKKIQSIAYSPHCYDKTLERNNLSGEMFFSGSQFWKDIFYHSEQGMLVGPQGYLFITAWRIRKQRWEREQALATKPQGPLSRDLLHLATSHFLTMPQFPNHYQQVKTKCSNTCARRAHFNAESTTNVLYKNKIILFVCE